MTTLRHVRTHLVRGLPFWLLRILFGIVSDNATPWVLRAFSAGDGIVSPHALSARIRRFPRDFSPNAVPR